MPVTKKGYKRKTIFFSVSAIILIAGLFVTFQEYKKISSEPIGSWQTDMQADCAVVLTGGANRVREGFDLLSRGQIRKLIISGVNPIDKRFSKFNSNSLM